jgi:hypothetical protein
LQAQLTPTPHTRFLTKWKRRLERIFTDPQWARYYLQLKVCDPRHRQLVASAISMFLPKSRPGKVSSEEVRRLVQNLREDGNTPLDGILSAEQVSEIRAYFAQRECYDPFRPELKGFTDPDAAHRSCIHAYFPKADVARAPHVLELANHPLVLGAVEAHFGVKPLISNISAWWLLHGFDAEMNSHEVYVRRPEEFHRDLDDFAEVKLFVYLTDVDVTAGPHAVIRASHKWRLPRGQRVVQLKDPAYPSGENLQLMIGPAGLAWLENSLTLHRGTIPTRSHRLMLSVTYTLLPIAVGPSKPLVPGNGHKFDSYINRILIET